MAAHKILNNDTGFASNSHDTSGRFNKECSTFVPMYRESEDGKTTIQELHKINMHNAADHNKAGKPGEIRNKKPLLFVC